MLIEIKKDIFADSPFTGLNYLLQLCFYKQRYQVLVDFSKISNTESFRQLAQVDKDVLEEQFNETMLGVQRNPDVTVSEKGVNNFNIDEALRYLAQPVSIVLENSLNDAYFLKALFKHFSSGRKLQGHLDNGWLQFENAGGCTNLSNFLKGKKESYNALPKESYLYLRCFVILDSDKKYPGQDQKDEYNKLIELYTAENVKIHVLEKRSMENYLPAEVFSEITGISRRFREAYLSMDPLQMDFFNLQKGFEVESRADLSPQVATLYQNVSVVNFDRISKGCGLGDFKTKIPKFMENPKVHKRTLNDRTSHQVNPNELQDIVSHIESML